MSKRPLRRNVSKIRSVMAPAIVMTAYIHTDSILSMTECVSLRVSARQTLVAAMFCRPREVQFFGNGDETAKMANFDDSSGKFGGGRPSPT